LEFQIHIALVQLSYGFEVTTLEQRCCFEFSYHMSSRSEILEQLWQLQCAFSENDST